MKKIQFILLVFCLFSGPLFSESLRAPRDPFSSNNSASPAIPATSGIKLKGCFQKALLQSETIKNQEEQIEQSNAKARSSLGESLPDLRWLLTDQIQDTDSSQGQSGGVGGTLTLKERIEHKFRLEQPLFSGRREASATKGFRLEERRDRFLFKRAELNLFLDVATAFYDVILSETILSNTRAALKLARERTDELKERAKLGKTRESEVLTAESQVALLKAQETRHLANVALSKEALSFLTGENIYGFTLIDEIPDVFDIPQLEQALEQSQLRTDIEALKADVQAKRFSVRYEKGSYWPSLDLAAQYYTRRVGFQDGIDWDALFTLDVPLYQGGSVSANVRRALSELRQTENELNLKIREVASSVRRSYIELTSTVEEARALEEAVRTAKKSYELHVKEYRYGLVNNLEVLAALNAELQDKQNLDETLIRKKLNYLKLKIDIEDNLGL